MPVIMRLLINILVFTFFECFWSVMVINANYLEDVFGLDAEDNEDNGLRTFPEIENKVILDEDDIIKSTRQDQEDVECFLNPGPMIAPDIILKGFVDSRISLTNIEGVLQISMNTQQPTRNKEEENSIMETEQIASDGIHWPEHSFVTSSWEQNENEKLLNSSVLSTGNTVPDKPCNMNFNGAFGGFNLSLDKDCVVKITNPKEDSRLILTCSPIPLGECSTHKDSLSINVMGDTTFKQNSFLYCGHDANIRAISFRNKLAIRVKKSDDVTGSTFCTYHSRMYREFYPKSTTVPCGRLGRIAKIVGGRRVPPGLFPWAVQLDITRTDGTQTGCTGTIVSPHYVLTAAHCMKRAESVSAFMGGTDRLDIIGTEVLIQAEKYILHKKWSSRTLVADIALVKLTHPIEYSDDISHICLPEGRLLSEDLSGRRGVAIGWGRTETKKKAPRRLYRVKLPLLSDSNCRNIYRRFYIPKVMMCTDSKKDAAICYGMTRNFTIKSLASESCGPLMYKRQDKVFQIGVASFSLSKTCGGSPDVFTKVGEFVAWVEKRVNGVSDSLTS